MPARLAARTREVRPAGVAPMLAAAWHELCATHVICVVESVLSICEAVANNENRRGRRRALDGRRSGWLRNEEGS
ncbi:hypothetical protein WS68_03980 [Burkholderia sp. TSV86]|nr:hypothetical protein WS68_03980 [Burkholderia sp. TSV86]